MKKILTIFLSVLCLLSIGFADDTQGSEMLVNIAENYEWTVPSSIELSNRNTKNFEIDVTITKCLLNDDKSLSILIGDDDDVNDFLFKFSNDEIPFTIAKKELQNKILVKGDTILSVNTGELEPDTSAVQILSGVITGDARKAGKYKATLTFTSKVGAKKVKNLTNATWVANSTVSPTDLRTAMGGNYTFNVDFVANDIDMIGFRVEGNHSSIKYIHTNKSGDFYTVYPANGPWKAGGEYNVIKFKNDGSMTEVAHDALIEWLEANGTLTLPVVSDEVIEDLTGYTWTANEVIELPEGYDASTKNSIYIDAEFGESSLTSILFHNMFSSDQMSYLPSGPMPAYNFDGDVWDDNSNKTLTFTSNVKTGDNAFTLEETVAWLQANGTLSIATLSNHDIVFDKDLIDKLCEDSGTPLQEGGLLVIFPLPSDPSTDWKVKTIVNDVEYDYLGVDMAGTALAVFNEGYTPYDSVIYMDENSKAVVKPFKIIGGEDANNPELIAFFKNNGFLK